MKKRIGKIVYRIRCFICLSSDHLCLAFGVNCFRQSSALNA